MVVRVVEARRLDNNYTSQSCVTGVVDTQSVRHIISKIVVSAVRGLRGRGCG